MPPLLPSFAALRAFEAVGRLGGIRRAANAQSVAVPLDTLMGRYGHAHLALAAARLVALRPLEGDFVPVALGAYVFRGHASRWDDPSIVRFRRWLAMEFRVDPADRI